MENLREQSEVYLVQREFKNSFRDFKLSMCEYTNDLSRFIPGKDGFEYDETNWSGVKDENGNDIKFPLMKVIPLVEGQSLKGEMRIFLDDQWRTKKSLKTTHPEIYKNIHFD